jgi:hypothetical protein
MKLVRRCGSAPIRWAAAALLAEKERNEPETTDHSRLGIC